MVRDLDTETVLINFGQQVDDVWISTPDGEILISWDINDWNDDECFLIKPHDNAKEFNKMSITKLLLKARNEGEKLTVFVTVQRN